MTPTSSTRSKEQEILLDLADSCSRTDKLCFNRFERLHVLAALTFQHRLMKVDEHLEQSRGQLPDGTTMADVASLLQDYSERLRNNFWGGNETGS